MADEINPETDPLPTLTDQADIQAYNRAIAPLLAEARAANPQLVGGAALAPSLPPPLADRPTQPLPPPVQTAPEPQAPPNADEVSIDG